MCGRDRSPDCPTRGRTGWTHIERNYDDEISQSRGVSKPLGYTHVVVVQPGKLVYVSGQVALNAAGEIVGKADLRTQVTQVMENLKTALAAAGAATEQIIKVNYYVVNLKQDQLAVIREVRSKYFSGEHPPASTLIGVTALAREEFMIEIEAVAAVK